MPAFDLDRSDWIIIEAEQRMTPYALRVAAMEPRGEDTASAVLMFRL